MKIPLLKGKGSDYGSATPSVASGASSAIKDWRNRVETESQMRTHKNGSVGSLKGSHGGRIRS